MIPIDSSMDKASKANQVGSFLTKVMLVPTEQVEKMSFQWIRIFPYKTEGSPPLVKMVFTTSIDKDLVSSNAKKLAIFNNSRKFSTIWMDDLTKIQQDLK
uniref:Uncharacterized protein n=1 Tax=Romanomermis culicivorax TaxID=13658 RepID=A0A915INR5_ROMCU